MPSRLQVGIEMSSPLYPTPKRKPKGISTTFCMYSFISSFILNKFWGDFHRIEINHSCVLVYEVGELT